MTCRSVRQALPLLAGGDLDGRRLARVRAHVQACPSCQRRLHELEASLNVLTQARDLGPEPTPRLWSRVGPRLASARFAPGQWRTGLAWRHVAAAAVMVVAVAFGVAMMPGTGSSVHEPVAEATPSQPAGTPLATDRDTKWPPVFVLDQAGRTWRHNVPDAAIPIMKTAPGSPRPIYVLDGGETLGPRGPHQAF